MKKGLHKEKGGAAEIGSQALYECASLESLAIPGSVTSIGENAFCGCTALRDISFSEGLENIGDYAFLSCSSLARVDLPSSLRSIGDSAFATTALSENGGFQYGSTYTFDLYAYDGDDYSDIYMDTFTFEFSYTPSL